MAIVIIIPTIRAAGASVSGFKHLIRRLLIESDIKFLMKYLYLVIHLPQLLVYLVQLV